MKTAVILGAGPEIDYFFSDAGHARDVICFSTNASQGHPARYVADIPTLNFLEPDETIRSLKACGVSKLITIGSIKFAGVYDDARTLSAMGKLASLALSAFLKGNSDAIRLDYFGKLEKHFEFPLVKSVLPFLFAQTDVDVNGNADLLNRVLLTKIPDGTDPEVEIEGRSIKIFRVPLEKSANLINRRLNLKKLQESHRARSVTHYIFDIDRTIIVGLEEMIAYARDNALTLQSFRELPRNVI